MYCSLNSVLQSLLIISRASLFVLLVAFSLLKKFTSFLSLWLFSTMPHASQPNHQPSIQAFLEWEQKDSTLRKGTAGSQNDQAQSYVPISALNDHFGEEVSVRKIISDLRLPQSPDPAYVWNHYRRVFAILLSINNGSMIGQFTNRQYLIDQYLPFRSRPPDFPASDDDSLWGAFYKRQWKFCPVPMPNGMRGEQPAEAILPFTIKEQIGQGKSASIHKIEVDSEYNSLVSQNVCVHLASPFLSLATK